MSRGGSELTIPSRFTFHPFISHPLSLILYPSSLFPPHCGPPGNRTPISWVQTKRLPIGPAARRIREVRSGIEPNPPPYRGGVLPKHLQTMFNNSDPGWSRTIAFLVVAQASLPLDHGTE
jgi:hypothetical protein